MIDLNKSIAIVIKDKDGNILLSIRDGQCMLARFKDIDEELKNKIINIFIDITDMEKEEVIKFLNFSEDKQRFCS
jgi:hypothetical protein